MLRVRNIKIDVTKDSIEELWDKVSLKLHINKSKIRDLKILKKSLDARDKKKIFYLYEVRIDVCNEKMILCRKDKDITKFVDDKYKFVKIGTKKLEKKIIIVGSGPAGLFCSYLLAEHGYKVLIIERGMDIDSRVNCVNEFWTNNKLNIDCNVQFGEGGAGTFSDGKLNTLVKDKNHRGKKAFEIFVENGAPEEILYLNKPHIGTDLLREIIKKMRNKIIAMGGEILYNTTLTDLKIVNNKIEAIEINNKEMIDCEALVLAIGHSARDTFYMLNRYLPMRAKAFAVGLRIMHPQKLIDEAQFGKYAKLLSPASYKLTYTSNNKRGVYSFCMCPGGYVVNASSEKNMLAINGMSNHKRDSGVANSAIIVSVTPDDFGYNPLDGIEFQRRLEKKAYQLGQGAIPVQLYKDFIDNVQTRNIKKNNLQIKGKYKLTNLNDLLPIELTNDLKEGINYFDSKIKGFAGDDALILGVESRTSSPVRILRNDDLQSSISGIFPCGEGAGYAGGITSAAMDGIKIAEEIAKIYSNK